MRQSGLVAGQIARLPTDSILVTGHITRLPVHSIMGRELGSGATNQGVSCWLLLVAEQAVTAAAVPPDSRPADEGPS